MKKAQGALEYLIVMTVVLAGGALVFAALYPILFQNQDVAEITSQKNLCQQKSITLHNYDEFPTSASDAATNIFVDYGERPVSCDHGSTDIEYTAKCVIGDKEFQQIEVQVNRSYCRFKNI
jgi:hypothetical protein